jgi:putative Mn2+ efflux pump MntP
VAVVTFGSIITLAIGLAMDATAAAATRGFAVDVIRPRHVLIVALFFGGFQALMPLLGWWLGAQLGAFIQTWDHWLAFILLSAVGGKMLWEAREADEAPPQSEGDFFGMRIMLVLAIATSIDAFAVGITLPVLNAPFALALATIGVTTAVLSAAGLFAGRRFGALLGQRLDAVGGVILIGLGVKILTEHLLGA